MTTGEPPCLSREVQSTVWPPASRDESPEHPLALSKPGPCPAVNPAELSPRQEGPDIWVYPNVFPAEFCDHMVARFDADPRRGRHPYRQPGDVGYQENRCCEKILIGQQADWVEEYKQAWANVARVGAHYFQAIYGVSWPFGHSGFEYLCYRPPFDHCNAHFDGGVVSRLASCITYLNDVDEGAETVFIRQGVKVKPTRGSVLLFPPSFTHPHYAPPPVSHPRHCLVTWLVAVADTFSRASLVSTR